MLKDYLHRVIDEEWRDLLSGLPAVAVEGPKAVGKTESALRLAKTVQRLDDPQLSTVGSADPHVLLRGDPPVLLDEWQRVPAVWDLVRRAVDQDSNPGRFLLTGSATPTGPATHSGAGRIVTLRMRPLTLAERRIEEPSVSLRTLLSGGMVPVEGQTTVNL